MADFNFVVNVAGGESVSLPVVLDSGSGVVTGMDTLSIDFAVQNTLSRDVSFTNIEIEKSGPSADKVTVTTLLNAMIIPAGNQLGNRLIVEPSELLNENDTIEITVSAQES